jgi:DNA-directed RNA polymerase specialized sigma24 family protein
MGWLLKPHGARFGGVATSRMKRGDQGTAVEARLVAHKDVMVCVAAAQVGAADAEDTAQEASVRAWRAWDELRDREVARSWPLRSAVNVCHD